MKLEGFTIEGDYLMHPDMWEALSYEELWESFKNNITSDKNRRIEQEFLDFPIGTHKFKIWIWFEETFNISVEDLMELKSEEL